MVFYFSGTGNSRFAASRIAEELGCPCLSINQFLKEGKPRAFRSEGPLVFVAPTYAWRIPRVVEQWIRKTRFEGGGAYFVLTCGEGCGNAAAYAKKLCKETGLRFCGLAPVLMPENYLAMFQTPDADECRAILRRAEPEIAAIAGKIRRSEPLLGPEVSLLGRLQSGAVNALFYPLVVHDRAFTVSDACVFCGKCARRCPMNNIDLAGGRPVWKGNCTHCMGCIASCPKGAIEYGARSRGRHRHDIMEEP